MNKDINLLIYADIKAGMLKKQNKYKVKCVIKLNKRKFNNLLPTGI